MNGMHQRGYIDLGPPSLWFAVAVLAAIGVIAILGGLGWLGYFIATHLRWT
jgi:hypothetical protein